MDDKTKSVYDKLVALFAGAGMPPSSAKVFTWLIVCEPAVQTAEDIRQATNVSAGGVSEAMSLLTKTGLVKRSRQKGERKYHYELVKDGFLESIRQRAIIAGVSRDIANEGLVLLPGNDRLAALGDTYGFLADRLPELIDEYHENTL